MVKSRGGFAGEGRGELAVLFVVGVRVRFVFFIGVGEQVAEGRIAHMLLPWTYPPFAAVKYIRTFNTPTYRFFRADGIFANDNAPIWWLFRPNLIFANDKLYFA